ncbi:MAG: M28 family peptidase [Verrucomicrobia bacterium]|nr:M28 family peptidase [Verrucomicrobiota bacterium]
MRKTSLALLAATIAGVSALTCPASSPARMLARVKVLASDEFEGRGPGTAGEEKTIQYLVGEYRKIGLEPGNPDGTYIQAVPLVGITSHPTLSFTVGGQTLPMTNINDFVGSTSRVTPHVAYQDTEVVFAGYGVTAPEYGWDDFKGVDVRGKTIVVLVNDPPVIDPTTGKLDPKVFGGQAMTYYGRWTYKYENAAAHGAAACLIVHETGPAGYPFAVVVGSRSRENFEIRTPDGNAGHLGMEAWLTQQAAERLCRACGQDFAALKRAAVSRGFQPVPLAAKASFTIGNDLRNVDSRNVVAKLTGSDPKLRDEFVVFTAHWDHLGRDPRLAGDQIFNGADDNASGVAWQLEVAQDLAALPAAQRPRRSVLFLNVTAEEKGLLGSRYYVTSPLYPLTRTVACVNTDGGNYYGRTHDVKVVGTDQSTLDDIGAAVARTQGRTISPDPVPEMGYYYRSDHFEFAKVGIPSYYPKRGYHYVDRPEDWGNAFEARYVQDNYHKVSDEVRPDWTFEGGAQDADFLAEVIRRVADDDQRPAWKADSQFRDRHPAGP